jgi:hypothetical protein
MRHCDHTFRRTERPFVTLAIQAVLLPLLACQDGSTSPSDPSTAAPAARNPAVTWETALGPGGARVPELPSLADPGPGGGISRLRGALFLESGQEILFIGTAPAGEPTLSPAELLDGFVVDYRALESGTAPAMSIDPTSDQVRNDLQEGDLMPVRYIACAGSAQGEVMFEGDRLMKTLGSGRDNVTRQPVTSRVLDYRSQLDMVAQDDGGDYTPWTRFWIEQEFDEVQISSDASTVLVRPKLCVKAKPQVPRRVVDDSGRELRVELTDADDSRAAPSARRFARHMTDHFEDANQPLDFAREFTVYRKLIVHATLVSLAEAVRTGQPGRPRPHLDADWILADHALPPFQTTTTTPATIATKQSRSGQVTRIDQLRGGVDLKPRNRYRDDNAEADELTRLVRDAVARAPGRRRWQVQHRGRVYEILAQGVQQPSLEVWQVDHAVGPVRVVRVLGTKGGGPRVGANWSLRLPRVELSEETAQFRELGTLQRFARVTGLDGRTHVLGQVGQTQLPGNPPTLAYSSGGNAKGGKRLLLYKNRWLYIDGEVQFVSVNSGPIQWRLSAGTTVLEFSAEAPHRLERVRTPDRDEALRWEGARLTRIKSDQDAAIDLVYDPAGQLIGLRGSDGSRIDYRFARDGFLAAVVDTGGRSITYARQPGTKTVTGMSARLRQTAPVEPRGVWDIEAQADWEELKAVARANSNDSQTFIGIRHAPAGAAEPYEVVIGGERDPAAGEAIARYLDAVEVDGYRAADPTAVRQHLESHPAVRTRGRIVLLGSSKVVGPVGVALRGGKAAPTVVTASEPQRALDNLRRPGGRGHRFVAVEAGLTATTRESFAAIAPGSAEGHVVVVAGHNGRELEDQLRALGGSLAGKAVVLVCCGKPEESAGGLPTLAMARGAKQVVSFLQPISVDLLAPVAKAVIERLNAPGAEVVDLPTVFREALKSLRESGRTTPAVPGEQIEPLQWFQLRIGKRGDRWNRRDEVLHARLGLGLNVFQAA